MRCCGILEPNHRNCLGYPSPLIHVHFLHLLFYLQMLSNVFACSLQPYFPDKTSGFLHLGSYTGLKPNLPHSSLGFLVVSHCSRISFAERPLQSLTFPLETHSDTRRLSTIPLPSRSHMRRLLDSGPPSLGHLGFLHSAVRPQTKLAPL